MAFRGVAPANDTLAVYPDSYNHPLIGLQNSHSDLQTALQAANQVTYIFQG